MNQSILIKSACGKTEAKICPARGFNLYSLLVSGTELLWADAGFLAGEASASGSGTPILFPIPGRLNGKTYRYGGVEYDLESDDGNGNAIHGFVLDRPWRLLENSESTIVGEFQASVDAPEILKQWPTDFIIRCRYTAVADGINAQYEVINPDEKELPCGLGTHAYFRVALGENNGSDSIISCPVSERWILEHMLATGEVVPLEATESFANGAKFSELQLDDVFSGIAFVDGRAAASIEDLSAGRTMRYSWDEACEICVIYTPPHREAICMEPYTLVPGGLAFDTGEHGLIVLRPGESFSHAMEIVLDSSDAQ